MGFTCKALLIILIINKFIIHAQDIKGLNAATFYDATEINMYRHVYSTSKYVDVMTDAQYQTVIFPV